MQATVTMAATSFVSPACLAVSSSTQSRAVCLATRQALPFKNVRRDMSKERQRRVSIVGMAPDDEKMTRRSPLDFPVEWDRPTPGRRPDIFPQFSPMKTPLPPPLPTDPPEEDEDEEEKKKEDDPDKEDKPEE